MKAAVARMNIIKSRAFLCLGKHLSAIKPIPMPPVVPEREHIKPVIPIYSFEYPALLRT